MEWILAWPSPQKWLLRPVAMPTPCCCNLRFKSMLELWTEPTGALWFRSVFKPHRWPRRCPSPRSNTTQWAVTLTSSSNSTIRVRCLWTFRDFNLLESSFVSPPRPCPSRPVAASFWPTIPIPTYSASVIPAWRFLVGLEALWTMAVSVWN